MNGFSKFWGTPEQRMTILAEVKKQLPKPEDGVCNGPLCFGACYISTLIDGALEGDLYATENLFAVSEERRVPTIFRFGVGCVSEGVRSVASKHS